MVKQKRLAKNAPVPCVVGDTATEILAEEDSLAESIQRAPLHPLDQFRAFLSLRAKELSDEEIAAAVFASVTVGEAASAVRQCLVDFTLSSDYARQEQVWETISASWSKEPWQIRRMLTERPCAPPTSGRCSGRL